MSGERPVERDAVGQDRRYAVGQDRRYAVPPGAPAWVTPDLIRETIETWQPYYAQDLTEQNALGILLAVANVCDVIPSRGLRGE